LKPIHSSFKITVALLFSNQLSFAAAGSSPNYLLYSLFGVGIIALIYAVLSLADNMMQIEAKNLGVDTSENDYSLFPSFSSLFRPSAGDHVDYKRFVSLNQGHDIKLVGGADTENIIVNTAKHYAIKPTNFRGMAPIPKISSVVGDHVKAGDALMFDKSNPEVIYAAPVSGELIEIKRGAKRAITEVIIKADSEVTFKENSVPNLVKCF